MNVFADTNWLEAVYFEPDPQDAESVKRSAVAERRMRRLSGPLLVSHVVLLEARNVFGRVSGQPNPVQWAHLVADFNGRIFVDTMNWEALRQQAHRLFERFSHKTNLGTFDAAIIASAQLAGAGEILSFDEQLKAIASAVGIKVFPELALHGRSLAAALKQKN